MDDLRPSGRTTETGVLRSGPRFECVAGAILVMEFTSTAGHSVFEAISRTATTSPMAASRSTAAAVASSCPSSAKMRMAAPYRIAFDYHCKLDMPADPIFTGRAGGLHFSRAGTSEELARCAVLTRASTDSVQTAARLGEPGSDANCRCRRLSKR
jgi:hypothetical protein